LGNQKRMCAKLAETKSTGTNPRYISMPGHDTQGGANNHPEQGQKCFSATKRGCRTMCCLKRTVNQGEKEQQQHADGGARYNHPPENPREHVQSMKQSC